MRFAETGFNLEIDLSRGSIEKVETDPRMTELHLGGQGAADRILWDRVPAGCEPFSPDNVLIFSTGLLVGAPVPGANRTIVNTFSSQTNLHAHSLFGGYFGAELKHAGYDKIVITGQASDLIYLWINNDRVEIRDARHLRGMGCQETQENIKKELKSDKIQVAAIGPAGENRVNMASIDHSHSSASRGVGSIMGSKRLKAIAVRGTKDIHIAHPAELFKVSQTMRKEMAHNDYLGDWMATDEDDSFHHNHFAWGNARVRRKNFWSRELEERWRALKHKYMLRQTSCYNCPKVCHNVIAYPGRPTFSYKCYGKDTYHMAAFLELDFSYQILGIAQEYGLDSYSTPQVIAFALELLEAGILTPGDFPGMPADSAGRFFYILEKIVHREGIGDILAHGVSGAAALIGHGAELYDHNTIKKFEQLPIKLGKVNPVYFLMLSTGEKISITQIEGSFPQDPLPTMEQRLAFVENWTAVPDDKFKKYFLEWNKREDIPNEAACAICDWNEAMHYLDDATGICGFLSSFRGGQFGGRPAYHIHNIPTMISLASGLDMDETKLWKVFQRNRNLVRALNVRRGMRRIDEKPPEDHWAVRDHVFEQKLLDDYYAFKGWTEDGIPTRKTLESLDLGFIADDFERQGILQGTKEGNVREPAAQKESGAGAGAPDQEGSRS